MYDFSEPQYGKDVCDRILCPMKESIRLFCNEGHDVIRAKDMRELYSNDLLREQHHLLTPSVQRTKPWKWRNWKDSAAFITFSTKTKEFEYGKHFLLVVDDSFLTRISSYSTRDQPIWKLKKIRIFSRSQWQKLQDQARQDFWHGSSNLWALRTRMLPRARLNGRLTPVF
jgi:hypothetical protein